jgi:UDP-GlcNAc:undecaprenyl-phosphate/decaprenyl-phosphate GlcNAc-1-phosphate transferase
VRLYLTLSLVAVGLGAILSAAGTFIARHWSRKVGFVDKPGGHKGHTVPVALGGGGAVTLAIILPILGGLLAARLLVGAHPAWLPAWITPHLPGIVAKTPTALGIVAATVVVSLLGLIDDLRPLGPGIKLVIQFIVAAFLVCVLDLRVLSLLGWVPSSVLSILWILTLTNSLNFLDNMDGLASGVAMIAAGVFATTAMLAGQIFVPAWCWLLVGSLAGFLLFNFHPASIYMGDAGSTVIGLLLAVLTILTTFVVPNPTREQHLVGVIAPLVVMAVPLYDTASVVFLRWRSGVPIWKGDRRHFSHRLVQRGMNVRKAVLVIWLATLVTALPALLLPQAGWPLAVGIMVQTLLVVALVALLESAGQAP